MIHIPQFTPAEGPTVNPCRVLDALVRRASASRLRSARLLFWTELM